MDNIVHNFRLWFFTRPVQEDIILFFIVLAVSFFSYTVLKKITTGVLKRVIDRITHKTKNTFDDHLFRYMHIEYLALFTYVAGLQFLAARMHHGSFIFEKTAHILPIFIITKLLHGGLNGVAAYTEQAPHLNKKSYRSYIQVCILLMYSAAVVIAAGTISGRSPWALLSGIGAMTAVLLLIFRETILSFVASLQISSYDLVRKGDWISVPRYEADGDVTEVALHTIKIQNWDKTISVVPTHDLMESGFKNWRGMQESGGRRIKRALFLDIASVRFMDKELRERIGKIDMLKSYFAEIEQDIHTDYSAETGHPLNGKRLTNIGTFRVYVVKYLQSLDTIRQDLTFLVRQLAPGPTGIPLELYVFTATTEWDKYETIQADIFDHLLAAAREFDLRIFQYPLSDFVPHSSLPQ